MQSKIQHIRFYKTKLASLITSSFGRILFFMLYVSICNYVYSNETERIVPSSEIHSLEEHKNAFNFIGEIKKNSSQPLLNSSLYTPIPNRLVTSSKKKPFQKTQINEPDNTIWFAMPKTLSNETYSPYGKKGWPLIFIGTFLLSLLLISKYNHQLRVNEKNLFKVHEANNEINRLKLHFYTTLTHDFKSPLGNILEPLQDLLSSKNNNVFVQTKLKYIEHNVKQLLGVVNQLTDYRKIEIEESKLVLSKSDIVDFLRKINSTNQILASTKNIQIIFKSKLLSSDIWFDDSKIETVLNTTLVNAINASVSNSEIIVSTSLPEEPLTILKKGEEFNCKCVLIKIALSETNKDFDSNNSSSISLKRKNTFKIDALQEKIQLIKDFLKMHYGTISITENGYTIKLPMDNIHMYYSNIPELIPSSPKEIQTNFTSSNEKTEDVQKINLTPSVLISDNDPDVRMRIKKELHQNYRIFEAENSKAALDVALKEIPNLIIGDVSTKEASGIELCSQLKNNVRTSHIPVILLSSLNSIENRIEGFESGADAYISKPIKMELLRLRVEKLVESRTQIHKHFKTQEHITLDKITLNSSDQNFLDNIKTILEKHLENESYSVDQLAIDMNISRSTLFRKLKHLTGHAPNEFIRTIRLKRAAHLLAQNQLTISEISYLVGFSDPNYFGKCFRKMFGDSPSIFASKHKNLKESGIKDFLLPN